MMFEIETNSDGNLQKNDFKASRGFVYLFKMINLVKDIEGYHKLIFETTFTIL